MIKRIASRAPRAGVPIKQVARTLRSCKPLFFALGDGTRQQIVLLLEKIDACNVTQLAEKLPLSRPAVSHHLRVLRQSGLVEVKRRGTENYYYLTIDDALALLKRFLHEVENCED
jgi:ArsR family transcriptional regulator, arsenate/arsenite/antimonite-responsive transcriptional repressor